MLSAAIRPSSSTAHATVSIARWITHANFSHELLVVLISSAFCAATSTCNISLVERVNLQMGCLAVERYLWQQTLSHRDVLDQHQLDQAPYLLLQCDGQLKGVLCLRRALKLPVP